MPRKRTIEEARNAWLKKSEAFLGPPDELSTEEAMEHLAAAGVSATQLKDALYLKLRERAQQYWMRSELLPPGLKKALEDLRPATAKPRNEGELLRQAEARVESILENIRVPMWYQTPPVEMCTSYRNKQGLSQTDKRVLDSIKDSLQKRIQKVRNEKRST
jgi:hypothetical protein